MKKALFHLSFKPDLAGLWKPQLPAGMELGKPGLYPEPDIPRISFSPTVLQCFIAIYPNISHSFEKEKYPNIEMYIYTPGYARRG